MSEQTNVNVKELGKELDLLEKTKERLIDAGASEKDYKVKKATKRIDRLKKRITESKSGSQLSLDI